MHSILLMLEHVPIVNTTVTNKKTEPLTVPEIFDNIKQTLVTNEKSIIAFTLLVIFLKLSKR